jgi:hypothetical protein
MKRNAFIAAAVISALCATSAAAQYPDQTKAKSAQKGKAGDAARPTDTTANQPSESGAQNTTPKGAVTGAGQPQGKGQPEDAKDGSAKAKAAR